MNNKAAAEGNYLAKLRLGRWWLTLDKWGSAGTQGMMVSLRESDLSGKPDGERAIQTLMWRRGDAITFLFELSALVEQMNPANTFLYSGVVPSDGRERLPDSEEFRVLLEDLRTLRERRLNIVQAYKRLEQRMPVLHLTQRVLETGSDDAVAALGALLTMIELKGELPRDWMDMCRLENVKRG